MVADVPLRAPSVISMLAESPSSVFLKIPEFDCVSTTVTGPEPLCSGLSPPSKEFGVPDEVPGKNAVSYEVVPVTF